MDRNGQGDAVVVLARREFVDQWKPPPGVRHGVGECGQIPGFGPPEEKIRFGHSQKAVSSPILDGFGQGSDVTDIGRQAPGIEGGLSVVGSQEIPPPELLLERFDLLPEGEIMDKKTRGIVHVAFDEGLADEEIASRLGIDPSVGNHSVPDDFQTV